MGSCSSNIIGADGSIDDYKRRGQVYRRVNLIEARKFFAELAGTQRFAKAFYANPISRNFTLSTNRQSRDEVITLKSSNGVELDGTKSSFCLSDILGGVIVDANEITDTYFLGLDRAQYGALHFSMPPTTITATQ